jgi:rhodanese-related sulfurtransferase
MALGNSMQDDISVQELSEILEKNPSAQIIDVREEEEHSDINIGGKLIPLGTLEERFAEVPKDGPVYLYCRTGRRSRVALEFLKSKGYSNCLNVAGGIMAWLNEINPEGRPGA